MKGFLVPNPNNLIWLNLHAAKWKAYEDGKEVQEIKFESIIFSELKKKTWHVVLFDVK